MKFFNLLSLIVFFGCSGVLAQGKSVLSPLKSNTYLKNELSTTQFKKSAKKATDTLQIPFFDDFAGSNSPFPNPKKWVEKQAFVNNNFPLNTISYNVATLEGLNEFGEPYNLSDPDAYGPADTLSSQYIDLSSFGKLDSIYLSFFYQRGGLADGPNTEDSLVVEFAINDSTWVSMLNLSGGPKTSTFQQQFVALDDSLFFSETFQFRFRNYATLSGNFDLWHIDYIQLDKNRSPSKNDLKDLAIVGEPTKFLDSEYSVIPITEYAQNLVDTTFISIKNNFKTEIVNFTYLRQLIYAGDTVSSPQAAEQLNGLGKGTVRFDPIGLTGIDASQPFGLELLYYVDSNDFVPINDTIKRIQYFSNFYAYDDGTAEFAYGIQDKVGAQFAMRFETKKQEQLKAVMMHFEMSEEDVANRTFDLAVWQNLEDPPIYVKKFQNPLYGETYNTFRAYSIDTPLLMTGIFYVGWIQNTDELLNLGFDVSVNNKDKVFINLSGEFEPEAIAGTPMIRLVIEGDGPIAGIPNQNSEQFKLFPNPVKDLLNFSKIVAELEIYNSLGQLVIQEKFTSKVNVNSLEAGLYFVKGITEEDQLISSTFIKR
jgi:hypothetical protein